MKCIGKSKLSSGASLNDKELEYNLIIEDMQYMRKIYKLIY